MDEVPKRIKRALSELAGAADEIELERELSALREQFARWERGELTAFDLSEAIHVFHDGPARDLYVQHTRGMPKAVVAYAIATGILDRSKIAPEVLEHLKGAIGMYEAEASNSSKGG